MVPKTILKSTQHFHDENLFNASKTNFEILKYFRQNVTVLEHVVNIIGSDIGNNNMSISYETVSQLLDTKGKYIIIIYKP